MKSTDVPPDVLNSINNSVEVVCGKWAMGMVGCEASNTLNQNVCPKCWRLKKAEKVTDTHESQAEASDTTTSNNHHQTISDKIVQIPDGTSDDLSVNGNGGIY